MFRVLTKFLAKIVAKTVAYCEKPPKLVDLLKTSNFLCGFAQSGFLTSTAAEELRITFYQNFLPL